jgi:PKD repeat protein
MNSQFSLSFKISGYKNNPADTEYYVDFGDGKIDTLSHAVLDTSGVETVSHKYLEVSCGNPNAIEDKYTFSLTAMRGCTTSTGVEIYKLATVGPFYVGMPPSVDFSISSLDGEIADTIGCVTEEVEFANRSEAGIDNFCETSARYTWDFGDDSPKISFSTGEEGEVVQHLYSSPGTYKVKLSIHHGCGTKSKTKTITIQRVPLPRFEIGSGSNVKTIKDCLVDTLAFIPTDICAPVSIPLKNISPYDDMTESWEVIPRTGGSAIFSTLTVRCLRLASMHKL